MMPWWMEEIYLFALNGHSIDELVVCIPNNGEEYIQKESTIYHMRSDTLYVPIQEYLDGMRNGFV